MKINLILPAPGKTGGVVVALEHARRLIGFGHDVRVYYPVFGYGIYFEWAARWKRPLLRLKTALRIVPRSFRRIHWYPHAVDTRPVPCISDLFLRDADVVIATAFPTAYDVAVLAPSKGRKFYFIQDHEIWNGHIDRVDATFRLPLGLITIAPWLTDLVESRAGRRVAAEVRNGVETAIFHPAARRESSSPSVLMMYHTLAVKGTSDGLEVIRRLKAAHPDLIVRMFGMYPFDHKDDFIEYTRNPAPARLVELYQQSDIFISPSLSEGWGLPPMEAMACGCAVVATRVGCIPLLEKDGNLMSAAPGDREGLFRGAEALLVNPELRRETARKGVETIRAYRWEDKSRQMERVLGGN